MLSRGLAGVSVLLGVHSAKVCVLFSCSLIYRAELTKPVLPSVSVRIRNQKKLIFDHEVDTGDIA